MFFKTTYKLKGLEPSSQASLAIARFGFFRIISDWWIIGPANVNQKNAHDDSLLHLAAESGFTFIVQNLINNGQTSTRSVTISTLCCRPNQ